MIKQYKDINLFLCITFLFPLIPVYLQSIIHSTTITFILYGIEAASPSIAALLLIYKNKNLMVYFKKTFENKPYLKSLILPLVISFSIMFLAKLISCQIMHTEFTLKSISLSQFIIILWSLIAEEFGWRGYLQPLLKQQVKYTYLVPFIVGIIWGAWHYHYFIFQEMQVPLFFFFISCIVESYIYSYLLKWTNNNLFSAMMYHFTGNLFIHIFALNPIDNMGNILPYTLFVIVEVCILGFLILSDKNKICKI